MKPTKAKLILNQIQIVNLALDHLSYFHSELYEYFDELDLNTIDELKRASIKLSDSLEIHASEMAYLSNYLNNKLTNN